MSNAQRQAVTERTRSSVQAAERPGAHPPRGGPLQGPGFRAEPAFISVLSSRRSGHTHAHAVPQDANRTQRDDQRQRTAYNRPHC